VSIVLTDLDECDISSGVCARGTCVNSYGSYHCLTDSSVGKDIFYSENIFVYRATQGQSGRAYV